MRHSEPGLSRLVANILALATGDCICFFFLEKKTILIRYMYSGSVQPQVYKATLLSPSPKTMGWVRKFREKGYLPAEYSIIIRIHIILVPRPSDHL